MHDEVDDDEQCKVIVLNIERTDVHDVQLQVIEYDENDETLVEVLMNEILHGNEVEVDEEDDTDIVNDEIDEIHILLVTEQHDDDEIDEIHIQVTDEIDDSEILGENEVIVIIEIDEIHAQVINDDVAIGEIDDAHFLEIDDIAYNESDEILVVALVIDLPIVIVQEVGLGVVCMI